MSRVLTRTRTRRRTERIEEVDPPTSPSTVRTTATARREFSIPLEKESQISFKLLKPASHMVSRLTVPSPVSASGAFASASLS